MGKGSSKRSRKTKKPRRQPAGRQASVSRRPERIDVKSMCTASAVFFPQNGQIMKAALLFNYRSVAHVMQMSSQSAGILGVCPGYRLQVFPEAIGADVLRAVDVAAPPDVDRGIGSAVVVHY